MLTWLRRAIRPEHSSPSTLVLVTLSFGASALWTGIGIAIALLDGTLQPFLKEWILLQAIPLIAAAIFLPLLGASGILYGILDCLLTHPPAFENLRPSWMGRCRILTVTLIAILGTASLISLGFNARGANLYFMWVTAALISFLAGLATWHAVEMILICRCLTTAPIKVFSYSPAETRELCKLAQHFCLYGIGITASYAFAFAGTMAANWTGSPDFVRVVQFFWPVIYVPLCLIILTYPHLTVHRIIRREKERILSLCQSQINGILSKPDLDNQDIERTNSLADFFEKVSATPNYAINVQIAFSTAVTVGVNLASLVVPREAIGEMIRNYLASI